MSTELHLPDVKGHLSPPDIQGIGGLMFTGRFTTPVGWDEYRDGRLVASREYGWISTFNASGKLSPAKGWPRPARWKPGRGGGRMYYCGGQLHRVNGPAVLWNDGRREWWVGGICYLRRDAKGNTIFERLRDGSGWDQGVRVERAVRRVPGGMPAAPLPRIKDLPPDTFLARHGGRIEPLLPLRLQGSRFARLGLPQIAQHLYGGLVDVPEGRRQRVVSGLLNRPVAGKQARKWLAHASAQERICYVLGVMAEIQSS